MNKKIIIILTLIFSLGGISSVLIIRYHSKNQDSLEVKEEETKEKEKKKESKSEEKKEEQKETKEEEKKEEQKEIKEEEKKEEKGKITDILWTCNWKGTLCALAICATISAIISLPASAINAKCKGNSDSFFALLYGYFGILIFIFEAILYPIILTIKKFGKKDIFRNLSKAQKGAIFKIIVDIILTINCAISVIVLLRKVRCKKQQIVIDDIQDKTQRLTLKDNNTNTNEKPNNIEEE